MVKIGDVYPVKLNEYDVAQAVVMDIDGDEVILEVPATRIVMGIKTALGDLDRTPEVDRETTLLPPPGGETSEAIDEARQALIDAGIELDEDDYTPPSSDGGSLRDMKLDDDV